MATPQRIKSLDPHIIKGYKMSYHGQHNPDARRLCEEFKTWMLSDNPGYGAAASNNDKIWNVLQNNHIPAIYAKSPQIMAKFAC